MTVVEHIVLLLASARLHLVQRRLVHLLLLAHLLRQRLLKLLARDRILTRGVQLVFELAHIHGCLLGCRLPLAGTGLEVGGGLGLDIGLIKAVAFQWVTFWLLR